MRTRARSRWARLAAAGVAAALSCTGLVTARSSADPDGYVMLYGYIRNSDGTTPDVGGFGGYEVGVSTDFYGFDWATGSYHGYTGLAGEFHSAPADGSYEIDELTPGATYRIFFDNDYEPPNDQAYDMIVTAPSVDSRLDVLLAPRLTCTASASASGVRQVGQTLTAPPSSALTLSPATTTPLVGYQWARYDPSQGWVPILGARDTTYTLTEADQGYPVDAVVTVSDGDADGSPGGFAQCSWPTVGPAVEAAGSTQTPPGATPPASPAPPPAVLFGHEPKVAGKPDPGHVLKPPPVPLPPGGEIIWQWYTLVGIGTAGHRVSEKGHPRPIHGAHHRTYKVKEKDEGSKVFVRMTVSAPGYATAVVDSKPVRIR